MSIEKTIRIGIIGSGFARKVQIPGFLFCPQTEIVSVASRTLANAESTAKEFNIPHFTDNWRETIENKQVDVVCITTPPVWHYEQTLYALEHGKHILCEKPMAMNAAETREMTEKAREKNVLAVIDHELRFQQGRQKALKMLRGGEIGKIRHVKYIFRAPHRGDPHLPWSWWSDETQGGGALGAIGSHAVDSLLWFSGTAISHVFGQINTHVKQRKDGEGNLREVTTDDEVNMLLRFADSDLTENATANVSLSMVEFPDYQHSIEFVGTSGSMRVDSRGEILLTHGAEGWREIETAIDRNIEGVPDTGFSRGFTAFAAAIIKTLQQGKTVIENAATFKDGLKVQIILDAVRESNKTGTVIKL